MDLHMYYYKKKLEEGVTLPKLAETFGMSGAQLSLVMNGRRAPSFHTAQRIEMLTGGEVTLMEMMAFCNKRLKPNKDWKMRKKKGEKAPQPQENTQPPA